MQVKDIMIKSVISVAPDDTLSSALSKMRQNKINQLLVMDGDKFYGLLELKKIITKDIDPSTAKVASLSINVPTVDINSDVESVAELLLKSGLRAIPVTYGTKVAGIVAEMDFMKIAKSFIRQDINAVEISSPAEYVAKGSIIGKARRIMLDNNVSRVPVVDKNKVVGIVSMLDLAKVLEGKESMPARGGLLREAGAKEKVRTKETLVDAVMKPAVVMDMKATASHVIDAMKNSEEVILADNEKINIVTPKDVLELLLAAPKEQVYVQITGMRDESIEFKAAMDVELDNFVQKMSKVVGHIEYLVLHVESMHKQGTKEKYSIRAHFKTSLGLAIAHCWGWKPIDVINDVFNTLQREVTRKHDRYDYDKKHRRIKERY